MRNLERSQSGDTDRDYNVNDQMEASPGGHLETTWDDIANLGNQPDALDGALDELPSMEEADTKTQEEDVADARQRVLEALRKVGPETSDANLARAAAMERMRNLRISDGELIELTSEWENVTINQEALRKSIDRNGNPNIHGRGLFFGSGNLPMSDDSVYRHVGSSAIVDLMAQGFVRNKREAADALDTPGKRGFGTIGPGVYWNDGDSLKREKADMVIQATKAAADRGYVTKDDIQGIWVTDRNTGEPVNLIDGQDHRGLEMADHKP